MSQAKDPADEPSGYRPAGPREKAHAEPDDNQFDANFCWHLNSPMFATLSEFLAA